MFTEPYLL